MPISVVEVDDFYLGRDLLEDFKSFTPLWVTGLIEFFAPVTVNVGCKADLGRFHFVVEKGSQLATL